MKTLIKKGRSIIGFVYCDSKGQYFYAFGKPSQSCYISFACNSIADGVKKIHLYSCSL